MSFLHISETATAVNLLEGIAAVLDESDTIPELIGMQISQAYDRAQSVRRMRDELPLDLPLSRLKFERSSDEAPRYAARAKNQPFVDELAGNIATLKSYAGQLLAEQAG